MIAISEDKQRLLYAPRVPKNELPPPPKELPLLAAHVCPACGVLIHALVETPEEIDFNACATATEKHQTTPKYDNHGLIRLGTGVRGQFLMEHRHFGIFKDWNYSQCKYYRVIHLYRWDPVYYARQLLEAYTRTDAGNVNYHKNWYVLGSELKKKLTALFDAGGPDAEEFAVELLNQAKPNCLRAEDLTGKTGPMLLITRDDWTHMSMVKFCNQAFAAIAARKKQAEGGGGA